MINKFIKTNDAGYVLGEISDNIVHQHYAVQLVISLKDTFEIKSDLGNYRSKSLLIKSMCPHQLICENPKVLIMLINPTSKLGHLLNKHKGKKSIQKIHSNWIEDIKKIAIKWQQNSVSDVNFIRSMVTSSKEYVENNNKFFHHTDKRIMSTLELLEKNATSILPLEKIASQVFLSASRFIHLFKKETGITYRRMQLWNKLMASVDDISNHKNITDLAHTHGFSDSAHYSRTFKQTFGITPKVLFNHSQFIQF